jgi:hypothetical protein
MIRTDGRPTIANAPARVQQHDVVPSGILKSEDALMEREYGGVLVELHRITGRSAILVRDGEGTRTAIIPTGQELDAFAHPYAYLPR